jgi:hypothetical protein
MSANFTLMRLAKVGVLSVTLAFLPGFAERLDTQTLDTHSEVYARGLQKSCLADSAFLNGMCLGYIKGVADTLVYTDRLPCPIPDGVTSGQVRDMFTKWIENHPEKLHEFSIKGIRAALTAFCRK